MNRFLALFVVISPSVLLAAPPSTQPAYLFSSFRGNGEDGLHLATSTDALHWTPLHNDQSFLKPEVGGKLMRDPSLLRGPDGTFHLVWTTSWTAPPAVFGYASSKDLIHWSEQRAIPVMEDHPAARNVWAPDLFYDDASQTFYILFSSTVPGLYADTDAAGDNGYNHRIYSIATKDFQTFSPTKLLLDPGFNVIDATMTKSAGIYYLVIKNETKNPTPEKNLRVCTAPSPTGPWSKPADPFTPHWVEGPTVLKAGDQFIIYYDHYTKPQHYGAMKTADFKTFTDITDKLSFPKGTRHGTAIEVRAEVVEKLNP